MSSNEQKWENYYVALKDSTSVPWPNEAMVKVVFGRYLANYFKLPDQTSVLDIGCGMGGNLRPFVARGDQCFGVEVTNAAATSIQQVFDRTGFNADVRTGSNRHLPFGDETFDLLLSINVVHYEKTESDLLAALEEYRRVLKPGGGVYISTVGPEHEIQQAAESLGEHRYKIRDYDFRNGEEYFYFDDGKYLQSYLERYFVSVETGQVTERLMSRPLDFLVAFARREYL